MFIKMINFLRGDKKIPTVGDFNIQTDQVDQKMTRNIEYLTNIINEADLMDK